MPVAQVLELEKLWTCKDLAEYFRVPVTTVRTAAGRGAIPGCTKAGGRYIFDRDVAIAGWKPAERAVVEVASIKIPVIRESEERLLLALKDVVGPEVWLQICERAAEQAIGGDRYARKWISDYLVGSPISRVAAEIGVVTRREFSSNERAAVVATLLGLADERETEFTEVDEDREVSDRQPSQERPSVDATSGEYTSDESLCERGGHSVLRWGGWRREV